MRLIPRTFQSFASRMTETRTDIAAVALTGDAESFVSMLNKAASIARQQNDAKPRKALRLLKPGKKLQFLETHPPIAKRCRTVEEIFGA